MPESSTSLPAHLQLASGAASGLASCVALQPLDLVKTRIQQRVHQQWRSGDLSSATLADKFLRNTRAIIRNEGLLALWNGLTPTIARNVPGVALYYYTLTNLRQSLVKLNGATTTTTTTGGSRSTRPKLPFVQDLFAGASSRVAVGFLLMPFTVIKTRAESSLYQHQGLVASFKSVLAQPGGGGIRGLFAGFWVTSLRDAPNAGLFVVFYERTRHLLQKSEALPPAAVDSLSALLGASAATLATSPFDMIKTQRQLRPQEFPSTRLCAQEIYRKRGLLGFFTGSSLRLLRKGGSSAIAWTTFEGLLRYFGRRQAASATAAGTAPLPQ